MSMGGNTNIERYGVEAVFENKEFEKNIKSTMNSLEDFEKALQLEGSSKGIEDLQKSFISLSDKLDPIADSVSALEKRFSGFGTAAGRVIEDLVDKAVKAGDKMIRALTVDNISAGWKKFGEDTKNIGTIISQGYSMAETEKEMERLLFFTDETSYAYTDMVNNISKFTAAGQSLHDAVEEMQGIALWAGSAGVNAQKASQAMYQLSQAMGAGYMRREDWKSIQTYNMDTKQFRQTALDTAVAMRKLKKSADGMYQSVINPKAGSFNINQFAEHLTEDKWFDSDVMKAVYSRYSEAVNQIYEYVQKNGVTATEAIKELQGTIDPLALEWFKASQEARTFGDAIEYVKEAVSTGWLQTFKLIFGNYEEATELWTNFSEVLYTVFVEMGEVRNGILKFWNAFGGREYLLLAIEQAFAAIGDIIGSVKEGLEKVFPPIEEWDIAGKTLFELTKAFEDFAFSLRLDTDTMEAFSDIGEAVASVFKLIITAIKTLLDVLKPLAPLVKDIASFLLQLIAAVARSITAFTNWVTTSEKTAHAVELISQAARVAIIAFAGFKTVTAIINTFKTAVVAASVVMTSLPTKLLGAVGAIKGGLAAIVGFLPIIAGIGAVVGAVVIANKLVVSSFGSWSNAINVARGKIIDFINSLKPFKDSVVGAIGNIPQLFQNAAESVRTFVTSFIQSFNFTAVLESAKQNLAAFVQTLLSFGKINFSTVRNGIGRGLSTVVSQFKKLPSIIQKATTKAKGFFNVRDKQSGLSKAIAGVSSAFNKFKGVLGNLGTHIAGIFSKIVAAFKSIKSFDDLKNKVTSLISSFKGIDTVKKLISDFGDLLSNLGNKISPQFGKLGEVVGGAFVNIGNFFKEFVSKIDISGALNTVAKVFQTFGLIIVGAISKLLPFLKIGGDSVRSFNEVTRSNAGEALKTSEIFQSICNKIASGVATLRAAAEANGGLINQFFEFLADIFNKFKAGGLHFLEETGMLPYLQKAIEFVKPFIKYIGQLEPAQLILLAFGMSVTKMAASTSKSIIKVSDSISKLLNTITSIPLTINNALTKISNVIGKALANIDKVPAAIISGFKELKKAILRHNLAKDFLRVALGISALALSLGLLAKFVDPSALMLTAGAITVFGIAITMLVSYLAAIDTKGKGLVQKAGLILSLAVAISIIAAAATALSKVPIDQFGLGMSMIAVIAYGMFKALQSLSMVQVLNVGSIVGLFIGLAVAFDAITVGIVALLGAMSLASPEAIGGVLLTITIFIGGIGFILAAASTIKPQAAFAIIPIIGITMSLYMLVGAILLIANAPISFDLIKQNLEKFVLVIGALAAIIFAATKLSASLSGFGVAIIGIAVALGWLAKVMDRISQIQFKNLAHFIGGIIVFFALLKGLGSIFVIAEGLSKAALRGAIGMVVLTVALRLMVTSLDALRAVIDKAGLLKIWGIMHLFTVLVILLAILAYSTKFTAYAKTRPIVALIAALGLMVVAIALLSTLPWPQIGKMAVIAVALAALFFALGKCFAQIADATTLCNTKTMVMFTFIVAGIVGALVYLSMQPWEKVIAAGAALFLAGLGIGVALGVIGEAVKAAKDAWQGALVIMAVALALIPAAYALSQLATFQPGPVLAAAGALGIVLLAMAGAANLAAEALVGALTLDLVIPALLAAAFSLKQLDGFKGDSAIQAAKAIGLVLLAMGAASLIASMAISGAIALDIVIPALVFAAKSLNTLRGFEGNSAITAAKAIAMVMFTMAGAATLATFALIGALALDIAVPSLIVAANSLAMLAQFPGEAVMAAAKAIITVLVGLAAAGVVASLPMVAVGLAALSAAALVLSGALLIAGNAAMLFANAMTIIMANLLLLSTMTSEQVSVISSNLIALGTAIGESIAAIIEGFFGRIFGFISTVVNNVVTTVTSGLDFIFGLVPQFDSVGRNLVEGLISGVQNLGPNLVTAVTNLGKNIIDTIKSVLGVHSPSVEFMNIMMDFILGGSIGLETGTPDLLGAADTMGDSVLDRVSSIFSYENASSIMSKFVDGLMSTLSAGISAAKSMLEDAGLTAAAALGDVDAQTKLDRKRMMKAQERDEKQAERERKKKEKEDRAAHKAMMKANATRNEERRKERRKKQQKEEEEAAKKAFDTGGGGGGGGRGGGGGGGSDKAKKEEKKKIDQFTKIMDYARDSVDLFRHSYASAKTELSDTQQYQASKNAVELLALQLYENSIASETAEEAAERMGKTQAEVAADIKKAYLDMQKGVEETLKSQLNMYEKFESKSALKGGELASNIQTNTDALKAWDNLLGRFSKRLEGVEGGLQIYNDLVSKGIDAMPIIKGWLDMTDEEFEKSVKNINEMPENIHFASSHAMAGAANVAYSLADGFKEVLNADEGTETGGIYGNAVLDGLRQSLLGGGNLQGEAAPVKELANEVASTMKEALDPNSSEAKESQNAASELGDKVTDAMGTSMSSTEAESVGKNLVEGIAKGIRDNTSIAIQAAIDMAVASLNAAKGALGIASPSKAFMELGYYSDLGLAQGFSKYGTVVREAAAESALGAVDEMSGVFGRIADLIDGTIDLDPTIRPVLDLSSIQYGASQIGSLLGLNDPYALNAVGTISGIQNDAGLMASLTSTLTDAINGLKPDNELPPVTINIYPTENQSAEEIADAVSWKLNHDVLKRRAVYGGT